ncbi:unnamed protein product, partial [Cyprideis torosa]
FSFPQNTTMRLLSSRSVLLQQARRYASSDSHCKLLVVGGGAGGCATAAKFAGKLKKDVVILEPAATHYYQPLWTMVGGGFKNFRQSGKEMGTVLPSKATWIRDKAVEFRPEENVVVTGKGQKISYDYMVVAMGIQLNYGKIEGLLPALEHDPRVCSNFSPFYVTKTYPAIQNLKEGRAIFTFPNTSVKCAGAPQKIMYIAEWRLKQAGKRDNVEVVYMTSLPVIFGVKKYAAILSGIAEERNIKVKNRRNLISVNHEKSEATFELLDEPGKTETLEYNLLHVTPPMSAPEVLKNCTAKGFVDQAGFLNVDQITLRHKQYSNVFGIGDCTSVPTAKTAAAVAGQVGVLAANLKSVMKDGSPLKQYDGYTSCPLVVGYNKCILAEFDFNLEPLETFPIDQGKPRWAYFIMKKDFMAPLYWHLLCRGFWNGPGIFRKMLHLGLSK